MKIELHYDPVRPETAVCINGALTDRKDVYGFLYPVRGCLLQAWLPQSGSWSGLRSQLEELARGEALELHFYGRSVDGADLRSSLEGMEGLRLELHEVDRIGRTGQMLARLGQEILRLLTEPVVMEYDERAERRKSAQELFPEMAEYVGERLKSFSLPFWLHTVETEDDFDACAQSEGSCVVLEKSFLTSLEVLHRVGELTRSLRRCPEMVWCRVEVERRRDFAYYAAQFPSLRLNLLEEDEDAWQQRLYSKYGKPYQLRSQLREVEQLLEQLEHVCGQQDKLREELKQLKEQGRTGTVTPALLRSQLDCTQKLRWITAKTKEIQQLRWQLDRGIAELEQPADQQKEG